MVSEINKGDLIQEILMNEHKISLHNFSFGGKHYSLNLIADASREYIGYEISIKNANDETIIPFYEIDCSINLNEAVNCYTKLYKTEYNKYINNNWRKTYRKEN